MAQLPINPPPSSVDLSVVQLSGKSRAVDNVSTQSRSSGSFVIEVKFGYSLLEFDERDEIMAFLTAQSGRVGEFGAIIPTHSENNGLSSSLATSAANFPTDTQAIELSGVVGSFKKFNLIRVNGKNASYVVTGVGLNVDGNQDITIMPPLREPLNLGDLVITKDVQVNMALDSDTISCKSSDMSASISFTLTEEPK